MLRTVLILTVLTIPLIGCKTVVFSRLCPKLEEYSPEFVKQLATEYADAIKRYPAIAKVVHDYDVTREDIRDCIKRSGKPAQ
jgi:hypothetical protein